VRSLRVLAVTVLLSAAPAPAGAVARPSGGPPPVPVATAVPVVIFVTVAPSAARSMTPALWRRLVTDYVGGHAAVVVDDDADVPDETRCRGAHGLYALAARFEDAPWLPGLARDPARSYGIVRLIVRNCITGAVLPGRVTAVDGDPLGARKPGDAEGNAERLWARSVRAALGRGPLLRPVARIVALRGNVALIERSGSFADDEVLHAVADAQGLPRAPFELVVIDAHGRLVAARLVGAGEPHVGDYVALSADPLITPWPEPRR